MSTVTADLRSGSYLRRTTASGWEAARVFAVKSLSGSTAAAMMLEATTASGIPALGDVYPTISDLVASQQAVEMRGDHEALVTVVYTEPEVLQLDPTAPGTIEAGAALTTRETTEDRFGNPLTVSYADSQGITHSQGIVAEVEIAQLVLRQTKRTTRPWYTEAADFTGKVNSVQIWGYAARTLLCRDIRSSSYDDGVSWEVSFEFQWDRDGWDQRFTFIDPKTGHPPTDISDTNGTARPELLEQIDFSALGIAF